jgi:hypothetical protein
MDIKETGNEDVDQLRLAQDTYRLACYILFIVNVWLRPGIKI